VGPGRGPCEKPVPHAEIQHRPLVIGIAGGIGGGKSTAARCFERLGCWISDSDTEAKAALDRPDVRGRLIAWWGQGILGEDGRIDRKRVAAIVFATPAERERLESLTHPLVHRARRDLIAKAAAARIPAVIVDAPLLFEAGVDAECDAIVYVDCPRERRLERVAATRGWDAAELDRRESAQMPLAEKQARSTHTVHNDGLEDRLCQQIAQVLDGLLPPRGGGC